MDIMANTIYNNPNVAYNYQKNPNLVNSNLAQSQAGLTIALRDRPNLNRNVNFVFPINLSTPNFNAGSPTLGARLPQPIGDVEYAGRQVSY